MIWDLIMGGLKIGGGIGAFAASGFTAAFIASLGGWILGTMSKLLDLSMYALVARFDNVIFGPLSPVINQLWTVFRDISNIIIIGMFTFVAISMIIGMQTFGIRRMIAKILIIAVLINFSLLFGRIIVESSNFVSRQFYCSMIASAGSDVCANGNPAAASLLEITNTETGIGLQFMEYLGVRGFWETREAANQISAASGGNAIMSRVWAILYGVLSFVLMVSAAAVFGYIIFLLVSRAILFIFLLVMSAPAFAAYLVPKYGDQYWGMWWNALLRNAIFGPLLMMLLWATFLISRSLFTTVGQGRSFDKLFATEQQGAGYLALLIFALILGMLFASARFATSFSKSIAGFDWAKMAPGAGVALGANLTGLLARQSIGRIAYGRVQSLDKQISEEKGKVQPDAKRIQNLSLSKSTWEKRAAKDFNIMNVKKGDLGNILAKNLGVAGTFADGKTAGGGYAGRVKEDVKGRADEFRSAAMSQEEVTKRLEKSKREAEEQKTKLEEERAAARESARDRKEAERDKRDSAQREKRDAETQHQAIETERSRAAQEHDREIQRLKEERDRAERIHGPQSDEANRAKDDHQAELNQRGAVIERAQQAAEERAGASLRELSQKIKDARTRVTEAESALKSIDEEDRNHKRAYESEKDRLKQKARDDEKAEAERIKSYHESLVGMIKTDVSNKYVAEGIAKEISATGTIKRLKDKVEELDKKK